MDLIVTGSSSCTLLHRKPPFHRPTSTPNSYNFICSSLRCRSESTPELRKTVGVTGLAGSHSASIPTHKVTVHDRQRGVVHEFLVPEDQYILHTAESQNITLPFACRHGIVL
uniref:Ferredoxin family protein n=1 Tax=Rhizophora mucronata TaxID=61149 RepID=A0A2P2K4H2_RHIMU